MTSAQRGFVWALGLTAAAEVSEARVNVGRLQDLQQQAERMGFVALLPGLRGAQQRSG